MAAPAAPLAPALPALGTAFALLILGLVIWAMRGVYMQTFGALLEELADVLSKAPLVGSRLAKGVDAINDRVQAAMAQAQAWANQGAALAWHGFTTAVEYTADTIADLANATFHALTNIGTATIPNAVGAGTRPLRDLIAGIRTDLRTLARNLERRLERRATAIEADLDFRFGLARRGIDAVRGSLSARIARGIDVLRGEIAALRRYAHRTLSRRLTRLEKALAAGALGGVAIAAITRVFPYWQCSNVRRFNRGVCRADGALLDNLLALTFAFTGTFGVLEFARVMQEVTEPFTEAVLAVVDDT